jgi:limonene 1,2-monooxygenase
MVGDLNILAQHWDVAEEMAADNGTTVDRGMWRLVAPMYLAETKEQAMEEAAYGIDAWYDYLQQTAATPHFRPPGSTTEERLRWVNESGSGVIGTPDEAIAMIEELVRQSNGGFGSFLMLAHHWARPDGMRRHYELFAEQVMPRFQPAAQRRRISEEWARQRFAELSAEQAVALDKAKESHEKYRATRAS